MLYDVNISSSSAKVSRKQQDVEVMENMTSRYMLKEEEKVEPAEKTEVTKLSENVKV